MTMLNSNINRILLIFLGPLVHGAQNLDYSDLEAMDIACPDRDRCQGYNNNRSFKDRSCECDFACARYNDCCIDVPWRSSGQVRPAKNLTCLHYGENPHSGVYAISTCSSNWNGPQQVREKCEGSPDFSDPVNAAPVTSISEAVTYKNLYCAECNNALMSSLKMFQFKLLFKDIDDISEKEVMDNLSYDEQRGSWGVNRLDAQRNSDFLECEIIFDVPSHLKRKVRFCRANIISKCGRDWTRQSVERACKEYMTVVYDHKRAYRNPHCAICNYKSVSEISCTADLFGRRPFSMNTLIDLFRIPECLSHHIYDPFHKTCKKLMCAIPGYRIVNRKCVRD